MVSNSSWYYLWVNDSTGNVIKQWYTSEQAGCEGGTGLCTVTHATALAEGAGQWWIQTWNNTGVGPWSSLTAFEVDTVSTSAAIDYVYDQQGLLISEFHQGKPRDYVYLHGQPLALIDNDQVYYYHNDHLGTPQVMTDENQSVVWKADYDPFGKATVTTETIINNIRFPGQYFDGETGLHYNYFRYYDPLTGRYVTSDPIGLVGGLNTYGYVDENPINRIDPLGLFSSRTTTKPTFPGPFDILFPNTPTNDAFVSSTKSFLNTIFGDAANCDDECDPPEGVKFNKVTHYSKHGRSLDPNKGSHGCMAKTGSPVHWHYDVNDKAPNGKCHTRRHVFGGCGVAPA